MAKTWTLVSEPKSEKGTTMAVEQIGTEDQTPTSTKGFGAREQADETRQASQGILNDAELDVNFQQVMVRSQALTVDMAGKEFASNSDTRQKIQDQFLARMGLK